MYAPESRLSDGCAQALGDAAYGVHGRPAVIRTSTARMKTIGAAPDQPRSSRCTRSLSTYKDALTFIVEQTERSNQQPGTPIVVNISFGWYTVRTTERHFELRSTTSKTANTAEMCVTAGRQQPQERTYPPGFAGLACGRHSRRRMAPAAR
jgi:hypothetical protein